MSVHEGRLEAHFASSSRTTALRLHEAHQQVLNLQHAGQIPLWQEPRLDAPSSLWGKLCNKDGSENHLQRERRRRYLEEFKRQPTTQAEEDYPV